MKLKSRITVILAGAVMGIVVLAGLTTIAQAALITVNFSGIVDTVPSELNPPFSTSDILTGSYTFESTTTPRAGSDSTTAVYDALTALSFTVGGYSASSTATQEIQVENGTPDIYAVVSRASDGLTGAAVNTNPLESFIFRLDDSNGLVFTDALILPTSLSLSDFTSSAFFVFFTNPNDLDNPFIVSGTITGLSQVPLPPTVLLLGSGLLGLVGFRRKFKK